MKYKKQPRATALTKAGRRLPEHVAHNTPEEFRGTEGTHEAVEPDLGLATVTEEITTPKRQQTPPDHAQGEVEVWSRNEPVGELLPTRVYQLIAILHAAQFLERSRTSTHAHARKL